LAAVFVWLSTASVSLGLAGSGSWSLWIASALVATFIVGPAEKLSARAYLQNELIALTCAGASRGRTAGAIALGALLFALWHIPQRAMVLHLRPVGTILDSLSLVPLALFFGILFAATRNVLLIGLIHGTINAVPLVVEIPPTVPGILPAIAAAGLLVVIGSAWVYRRWAIVQRPLDFRVPVAGENEQPTKRDRAA